MPVQAVASLARAASPEGGCGEAPQPGFTRTPAMARLHRFAAASALAAGLSLAAAPAAAQGYYHYGHHHHGVDGGDVLAGAAIIGGIAAIASVAGHHDHAYSGPQPPGAYGHPGYGGPGLDRA